ncbi:coatomer subunit gamma-like isoform X3 [Salvia miltiorrhiza]|uniref:coatomer subunit gamma-like isoform X3 n=1 Tax=Salvia miltiorrhiza TaxID=226208 RepID=UPI0025AD582F|nr:coatomer subunit gamma-like isoform X3 [Salvia miltiorrhiza]
MQIKKKMIFENFTSFKPFKNGVFAAYKPNKFKTMLRLIKKRGDDRRRQKANCSWFVAIEKRAVLTEVRSFGDPHLDKARCLPTEAAAVLSSVIKLYRFQDIHLRRMFYLIAKELCPVADEVELVTSSILKDTNSRTVIYRANAIRLLCRITIGTSSTTTQIEKCLSDAFGDKNHIVQSAALVCAINLIKRYPMMRYRIMIINLEKVLRTPAFVEYHSFYLTFMLRIAKGNVLEGETLVSIYTESINDIGFARYFSSPLSPCFLARLIRQISRARHVSVVHHPSYFEFLKSCIYHEDERVAIEGFRSLQELRDISFSEIKPALYVIQQFCCVSPKPVLRFGAFRALQKVCAAQRHAWAIPRDYITICRDENAIKLYHASDHRENEAGAEVTQVVKSQSCYAMKEASIHNLRRRQGRLQ